MRLIFLLLKQELRVVLADKKALALLFVMPSLLIVFLSLAMKDIYLQKVGQKIGVTFLLEKSILGDQILSQFSEFEYQVKPIYQYSGVSDYIEENSDQIVIAFPQNISEMIKGKDKNSRIKMYFDPALDKSFTELVKSHLLIALQSMVISQVNNKLRAENRGNLEINQLAMAKEIVEEVGKKQLIPNSVQQTVPGWALFAMFFIALPMASSFIRDRHNGVLKRLLCYNLKKSHLLFGKIIPYLLINNLQFYLMMLLGLYVLPPLMGATFVVGPMGLGMVVICFVCSLTSTSYGLLVSSLAKSHEQASSLGAILVVIMALFGGVMIPSFVMPVAMQKVAFISPLYWGMESYLDFFLRGESLLGIFPRLAVLLIFSTIAFMVALTRFRWSD